MASRVSFRLHMLMVAAGVLFLVVAGGVVATLYMVRSDQALVEARSRLFPRVAGEVHARLDLLFSPADVAAELLALQVGKPVFVSASDTTVPARLATVLRSAGNVAAIFTGYEDGDFFLLRRIPARPDDLSRDAPEGAEYVLQCITHEDGGERRGFVRFYDAGLRLLATRPAPGYAERYDPRQRPWYLSAQDGDGRNVSTAYTYFSSGEQGVTLSRRTLDQHGVVGVDMALGALVESLAGVKPTAGAALAMVNEAGDVVVCVDARRAAEGGPVPPAGGGGTCGPLSEGGIDDLLALPAEGATSFAFTRLRQDGRVWLAGREPLRELGGSRLSLVLAAPADELLAGLRTSRDESLLFMVGSLALMLPLLFFGARLVTRPLRRVAEEAERGRRFDFSTGTGVHSVVTEVEDLAASLGHMRNTIRRFLQLAQSVSRVRDFDRLVPLLVQEMRNALGAQAGLLYLPDAGHRLRLGASCGADGVCVDGSLVDEPSSPQCVGPVEGGASLRTGGLPEADAAHPHLSTLLPEASTGLCYAGVSLRDKRGLLLGELLLVDAVPFSPERLAFLRAASGVVEVALDNDRMVKMQKELFSSFIRLLAQAIDAKSPYTGGHCARVPVLSKMLAEAACKTASGPYAGFAMSEEEWEELHIASWLHDCGKVTTPEFVVDKATKLETIHDRIHEVRTRFEVLKRDAHIAYWKAVAEGGDRAALEGELEAALRELDDDFAFVATCNDGEVPVDAAGRERLARIARRTWERTLDDTLGVAWADRVRREHASRKPPVVEPLLRDGAEFIIPRAANERGTEERWGFSITPPEALYDRGELHNLSVPRGTLTGEDRYKINEHIMQTIVMLSELPFPDHLKNVPEVAGGHHERMDGTGYPRGLRGELLHPLARMLAIADVFEALTAPDRPYKQAKTLSQAMRIMVGMARGGHMDSDLLALFIREGVYEAYAEAYLPQGQRDAVDRESLLLELEKPA